MNKNISVFFQVIVGLKLKMTKTYKLLRNNSNKNSIYKILWDASI